MRSEVVAARYWLVCRLSELIDFIGKDGCVEFAVGTPPLCPIRSLAFFLYIFILVVVITEVEKFKKRVVPDGSTERASWFWLIGEMRNQHECMVLLSPACEG